MPCCITIIEFRGCGHSQLYSLGCTKPGCTGCCPPKRRECLLKTYYLWSCPECAISVWRERVEERKGQLREEGTWKRMYDTHHTVDERGVLMDVPGLQRYSEDKREDERRKDGWNEKKAAITWTRQYAEVLWDLAYAQVTKPGVAWAELLRLRGRKPWDLLVLYDKLETPYQRWHGNDLPENLRSQVFLSKEQAPRSILGLLPPETNEGLSRAESTRKSTLVQQLITPPSTPPRKPAQTPRLLKKRRVGPSPASSQHISEYEAGRLMSGTPASRPSPGNRPTTLAG